MVGDADTRLALSLWEPNVWTPREVGTIGDAVRAAAERWPDRPALIDGGDPARRWTFTDLLRDGERLARWLAARFAPGSHIALWSPNRPEWIQLEIGAALAGLTLVTVNPAFGQQEAAFVLSRSECVAAFVEPSFRGVNLLTLMDDMRATLALIKDVIGMDDVPALLSSQTANSDAVLPQVAPGDPAQIQYTSGTTGFPKGARLSHRGLVDNGWLYATAIGARADDIWLNPMPLFHTAGCGLATLGALQTGGCQILLRSFDADRMLDLVGAERASVVLSVPTMLVRLLEAQRERPRDVSSLRLWTLGGAPIAPELITCAADVFDTDLAVGFGQTETSPYITHTVPRDPHPQWIHTVGRPLAQIAVRIAVGETGATLPIGEVGEICTRSACVMIDYYNDPSATAQTIDPDGWLHTGDLGSMDSDGYVRIAGRIKDLIIRGGENIYPREIEDVLYEHPAVDDAACIGVPDPHWGEQVAAFVRVNADVDPDALSAFCSERLASFKVPRIWRFVDDFPQTASGKIRKVELAQLLATD